jgi:hypothetical protein
MSAEYIHSICTLFTLIDFPSLREVKLSIAFNSHIFLRLFVINMTVYRVTTAEIYMVPFISVVYTVRTDSTKVADDG